MYLGQVYTKKFTRKTRKKKESSKLGKSAKIFRISSLVMNLFLRVGNKNNSCIRETQENSIENSSTN